MSIEFSGLNELDKNLRKLAVSEKKIRNRAIRKAGEAFAERLERNTPVDRETERKGSHVHMKDDVQISGVNQDGIISVGYGKETHWRVHFAETGTIKQRPQGFMQQTEEEMQDRILEIMQAEIRKGLGL